MIISKHNKFRFHLYALIKKQNVNNNGQQGSDVQNRGHK